MMRDPRRAIKPFQQEGIVSVKCRFGLVKAADGRLYV